MRRPRISDGLSHSLLRCSVRVFVFERGSESALGSQRVGRVVAAVQQRESAIACQPNRRSELREMITSGWVNCFGAGYCGKRRRLACGSNRIITTSHSCSRSRRRIRCFDQFFMPIACPIFYVETLGNLAKEAGHRGPPELLSGTSRTSFQNGRFRRAASTLILRQATFSATTLSCVTGYRGLEVGGGILVLCSIRRPKKKHSIAGTMASSMKRSGWRRTSGAHRWRNRTLPLLERKCSR